MASFFSILKIIFLLILITGLIYGMLYLMKKYIFAFDKNKAKLVNIKVLSTQMLMPKKFIQVVQVHDRILVIGVSDHSINLLDKFDDLTGDLDDDEDLTSELKALNGMDKVGFKGNLKENLKENFLDILKKNLGMK